MYYKIIFMKERMMNIAVTRRETCRLCNSSEVKLVVNLHPVPLAEKYTSSAEEAKKIPRYPINLYMCHKCSHVQLLDVINSKDLWSDYTYHSGQTQGIINHFEEVSQKIISKYTPLSGSLIVDVGSNDGTLLRFFKNAGYTVHGIDPAKDIAAKATASGIETTPSVITAEVAKNIRQKYGSASVVTAFNVYAHADNLGDMTDAIFSLLSQDCIFVFEVQYLMDIIDKVLIGTIFHEHMSHHSLKPLIQFLNAHQLELIDVERISIQKGSIIGVAQPKGGPRQISSSVRELVKLEESRSLDKIQTMEAFNVKIEGNRNISRELVKNWVQQKLIVAGYGAARSGPTLIAQFEFEGIIQYIFDDHSQKINRFSPSNGIPVIPTTELLNRKPDIVIILAWIHARAIVEKNQAYIDAGGKFVICTPEVRIIDSSHPL